MSFFKRGRYVEYYTFSLLTNSVWVVHVILLSMCMIVLMSFCLLSQSLWYTRSVKHCDSKEYAHQRRISLCCGQAKLCVECWRARRRELVMDWG